MELRLYSFVNYYLSDMQKGIQTGHMAVDLVREYGFNPNETIGSKEQAMVADWADNHKTFIVLNGGNNAALEMVADTCAFSGLPWTTFYEDQASLGGIRTCVGVVVPENYFDATYGVDEYGEFVKLADDPAGFPPTRDTDNALFTFIKLLKTSRLA